MKIITKFLLLFLAIGLIQSCRIIPSPKLSDKEVFNWDVSNVRTLGIIELSSGDRLNIDDGTLRHFEAGLSKMFEEYGYRVVPLDKFKQIVEEEQKSSGGFFNPLTGKKDKAKFRQFNDKVGKIYTDLEKVDLLIGFKFFRYNAPFISNKATWHNLTDLTGSPPDFLFDESKGNLPVVSVEIRALEVSSQKTFKHLQGIQVLLKNKMETDIHPDDVSLHINTLRQLFSHLKK